MYNQFLVQGVKLMIKLSELLGKQIICLTTAKICGTIENIIFDNKLTQGKLLKVYSDSDDDAREKYIPLKKVKNLNSDAVVVDCESQFSHEWNTQVNGVNNPINLNCFNQDGLLLGSVKDIELDGTSVSAIVLANKTLDTAHLLSYSNDLLIFNDTGKEIKIKKPRKKTIAKPDNTKVFVHTNAPKDSSHTSPLSSYINSYKSPLVPSSATTNATNKDTTSTSGSDNIKTTQNPTATTPIECPSKVDESNTQVLKSPTQKITSNDIYAFLVGKITSRDISNDDKQVIVKANTTISFDTINIAKASNKLVQLALYSD